MTQAIESSSPRTRPKNGADGEREIRICVRCPNPDCGAVYYVHAQHAGKRGRCSECGAAVRIPRLPPEGPPQHEDDETPGDPRSVRLSKQEADNGESDPHRDTPEVRLGCIGRGHAGKTALFHALSDCFVGDFLPSGLHLDANDPREVARMIRDAEMSQRLLHQSGLPPTMAITHTRYAVYEGDRPRLFCRMQEVIGQVLTHTLPDSEPQLQARYSDYIKSLVNAHVLWVVVPCPPAAGGPADRRRYANDLRITLAYLREALRVRTLTQPVALAVVLSKADALFDSPESARAALSDDGIQRALGPLLHFIEQSEHISDAAAFPVTAFGFGQAVLRTDGGERYEAPGSSEEPFGDEPIWLLKDGESPRPHNLDGLFLWSILLGLLNQLGAEPDEKLDSLCRMLRDDLEASDPWMVQIKGGVNLTQTSE